MKRPIIQIDESLCDGCGACIPDCPEGALQIIDGKARLVSEPSCDGLGACINRCPHGAISVELREAPAYNERAVIERIIPQGVAVVKAHLAHLRSHKQYDYLAEARRLLADKGVHIDEAPTHARNCHGARAGGCPGTRPVSHAAAGAGSVQAGASALRQWPVQLHLLQPQHEAFRNAELLLAADCAAFACGNFHARFLAGRAVAIACPKLDNAHEEYIARLQGIIKEGGISGIRVVIMEVPCCRGMAAIAREAVSRAKSSVPLTCTVVSIKGEVLREESISA